MHPASVLALSALLAGGCAFGARRVELTYNEGLRGPEVATQARTIAVARFEDARESGQGDGRLLGKVRNTYGIPTASVVANQDPLLWVNEGIVLGLQREGFRVEKVDSPAAAGDLPTLTGKVTRASGGMYMRMDANIEASIAIEARGTSIMTTSCTGHSTKTAWTASASEYRTVFADAMDEFVEDCVPKLKPALLDITAP